MKKKKCIRVGITGNIGSGKTLFSSLLVEKGFPVLFADDISKEILEADKTVIGKVRKKFGEESYKKNKPDKTFLAETVFNDPVKLQELEAILHPEVINRIRIETDKLCEEKNLIFIEAALIYEADMEQEFDHVVLITADEKIRLKRKLTSGLTEEDFIKRELNQIPETEKTKRADFIFKNEGSKKELNDKADLLINLLS